MTHVTTRAVPVAQALQSLIPAAPAVNPTPAQLVHRVSHQLPVEPVYSVQRQVAPIELQRAPSGLRVHWIGLVSSLAIVSVVAAVVLLRTAAAPVQIDGGRILGVSASQPLRVTVSIAQPTGTTQVSTTLATGTVAEALSRAATSLGQDFTYVSRGASIYIASFAGQSNRPISHWQVRVNAVAINDLTQTELKQGDHIFLTWQ